MNRVDAVLLCVVVFLGVNVAWLLLFSAAPAGATEPAAAGATEPAAGGNQPTQAT